VNGRFAYRVCYMALNEFGEWQTDLSITGWATDESLQEELEGAYAEAALDKGQVFTVLTLPEGDKFEDGPLHLELVH